MKFDDLRHILLVLGIPDLSFSGRKSPKCKIFHIFISHSYDVIWLQNLHEIIKTSSCRVLTDVEPVPQDVTVSLLVSLLVTNFSRKPLQRFLSYFAWKFSTIRARNVHGRFFGLNPDHSKITKTCQKWRKNEFFWILTKI